MRLLFNKTKRTMLTNLLMLFLSLFGLNQQADSSRKPAPDNKPGTEIPKPSSYDHKSTEKRAGGGWDLN